MDSPSLKSLTEMDLINDARLNSALAASQFEKWWLLAWCKTESSGIRSIPSINSLTVVAL